MTNWVFDPWYDECYSSFSHAWEVFWAAFRCALLGHKYNHFGESRDCDRCNRKWRRVEEGA